jgi:Peptidase family M1 domain
MALTIAVTSRPPPFTSISTGQVPGNPAGSAVTVTDAVSPVVLVGATDAVRPAGWPVTDADSVTASWNPDTRIDAPGSVGQDPMRLALTTTTASSGSRVRTWLFLMGTRVVLSTAIRISAIVQGRSRRTPSEVLLMRQFVALLLPVVLALPLAAQGGQPAPVFTHADTLRGSFTTPGRVWWDVAFYDLHVNIHPSDSTIDGYNGIAYRVLKPSREMQIDLMTPLDVDSMVQNGRHVDYRRDGNAFFATLVRPQHVGDLDTITVYYHGRPRVARRPPWEGGFSWNRDSLGNPWVVTTDQGVGASIWWPNKDTQADEPDSQRIALTVPDPMIDVSNGRLRSVTHHPDHTTTYEWFDASPINNYAIAVAAGTYAHYSDTVNGEAGKLSLDFWPLAYHLDAAHRQWPQARSMLQCFEHWFGPYPWYKDGYKLIEVPNAGMEHQSAVAYGNGFRNGYGGRGASLRFGFDFIIIHESAHEWFGNSITAKDQADMWVHESFANYAEGLYTECKFNSKDSGAAYILSNHPRNDSPIIPAYGVNAEGSGDMYGKGGLMLHTIRQIVNDDERWRGILHGLQSTFRHQTVMGSQIEHYISQRAGRDLSKVFDEYLRTTMIPEFEYRLSGDTLAYRWADVVPGFDMPVKVTVTDDRYGFVYPTEAWKTTTVHLDTPERFRVDSNFLVWPWKEGDAEPAAVRRGGRGRGAGVFGGRAGGATARVGSDTTGG